MLNILGEWEQPHCMMEYWLHSYIGGPHILHVQVCNHGSECHDASTDATLMSALQATAPLQVLCLLLIEMWLLALSLSPYLIVVKSNGHRNASIILHGKKLYTCMAHERTGKYRKLCSTELLGQMDRQMCIENFSPLVYTTMWCRSHPPNCLTRHRTKTFQNCKLCK